MRLPQKSVCLATILAALLLLCVGGCGEGGGSAAVSEGAETDTPANDGGGDALPESDGDTADRLAPRWDPNDFDTVYTVGPDAAYADPGEVPWEALTGGTLVLIHWRAEPYRSKWVINTVATADKPLVVMGIASQGRRPVISGAAAETRRELNYWNENRSVIKVGGSNLPSDNLVPAHVVIQGLEIRSARPAYHFTDDQGEMAVYAENAAAIHVERGQTIQVIDCVLHDAGNGLFSGHGTYDLLIRACHLYDNGIEGSIYHHNAYTESAGIIFDYNHFGPLREGALGNNLKDRSAGTVIRYNWIEGGNRQLDLVETDHAEIAGDPAYAESFVYGNILVEPEGAGNSQVMHYGGDGGGFFREGTLYFYHNTVISTRSGNTTLLRLSTNNASADLRNNLLYASSGGSSLAISSGRGQIQLQHNWLPTGWRETHEAALDPGAVVVAELNVQGDDPGILDLIGGDVGLAPTAAATDCGGNIAEAALNAEGEVIWEYRSPQSRRQRSTDGIPDAGAFEWTP